MPETAHAVKGAIEESMRCKRKRKAETILFNMSVHGQFDMADYTEYFSGKLVDKNYDEQKLADALSRLTQIAAS